MVGVYAGSHRMKAVIIALGVLFCSAATAEPRPWMKKENPETLHFVTVVQGCPHSDAEVRKIINGVLIRSRLRPGALGTSSEEPFGFALELSCLATEDSDSFFYSLELRFMRLFIDRISLKAVPVYRQLGRGYRGAIEDRIRGGVEDLLADYLQANFDLTPE